jgi:hypothetical protein
MWKIILHGDHIHKTLFSSNEQNKLEYLALAESLFKSWNHKKERKKEEGMIASQ